MTAEPSTRLRKYRVLTAPGTPLRAGLDRIVRGRTGALVVVGTNRAVEQISTGGFPLDVPYTPTALRELAKMDGAIILSGDCDRILSAGVHLMPDPTFPTDETGTRHRTADRVAQQTGCPVITVSESMNTISVFSNTDRLLVERPEAIMARANLAMQTLERFKGRLLQALSRLSSLEVQEQVTIRDVALVAQRHEMLRRLLSETEMRVTELGTDGRLVAMQLSDVQAGLEDLPALLEKDYCPAGDVDFAMAHLTEVPDSDLVELTTVSRALGFNDAIDTRIVTRGFRQLASIPRLPTSVAERLVDHFGDLQGLFSASRAELQVVEGVGEGRARMIRDGLTRLAESAYNERPEA